MSFYHWYLAWVKSFRSTVFKMADIPAWVGIAQILGGPIGNIAAVQHKKKFNDFMFGTICEKVRVQIIYPLLLTAAYFLCYNSCVLFLSFKRQAHVLELTTNTILYGPYSKS